MAVTFLIGNGFDLGIGLKTAYTDFFKVYCEDKEADTPAIKEFKSALRNDYETWSDFEKAFGEYASQLNDVNDYIEVFENFVETFSDYLEREEKNFDLSKSDIIIKKMMEALTTYYNIRPADREPIVKLINGNKLSFNFISFNYTHCLDECLKLVRHQSNYDNMIKGYIGKIVHVHGHTENNMIMGVNDTDQIKNNSFAQNPDVAEEIVKPLQNQIIRMNFDSDAEQLIENSDIICVYGMSIGTTDKKWWKLIMDWLQKGPSNQLILLQHRVGAKFTFRWNRLVKDIRAKLFLYGEIPDEKKKSLESRIHIEVNHDIFAMDLRKELPDGSIHLVEF